MSNTLSVTKLWFINTPRMYIKIKAWPFECCKDWLASKIHLKFIFQILERRVGELVSLMYKRRKTIIGLRVWTALAQRIAILMRRWSELHVLCGLEHGLRLAISVWQRQTLRATARGAISTIGARSSRINIRKLGPKELQWLSIRQRTEAVGLISILFCN